jgi:hypothetical protein
VIAALRLGLLCARRRSVALPLCALACSAPGVALSLCAAVLAVRCSSCSGTLSFLLHLFVPVLASRLGSFFSFLAPPGLAGRVSALLWEWSRQHTQCIGHMRTQRTHSPRSPLRWGGCVSTRSASTMCTQHIPTPGSVRGVASAHIVHQRHGTRTRMPPALRWYSPSQLCMHWKGGTTASTHSVNRRRCAHTAPSLSPLGTALGGCVAHTVRRQHMHKARPPHARVCVPVWAARTIGLAPLAPRPCAGAGYVSSTRSA